MSTVCDSFRDTIFSGRVKVEECGVAVGYIILLHYHANVVAIRRAIVLCNFIAVSPIPTLKHRTASFGAAGLHCMHSGPRNNSIKILF